jgi:hypothetical protein
MSQISLHNKHKEITGYCIVSPEDYLHLNKYKWYINGNGYVQSHFNKKTWSIHRYIFSEILKKELNKSIIIDHIDNNKLNNSRENLRIVTFSENSRNRKKRENTSSKYIGVCFNKKAKLWESRLKIDNKELRASYNIEEFAAYQYNIWCKEHKLNIEINNIDKPVNFVLYIKPEKKGNDIPKGINIRNNKYCVNINAKHYGYFKNLKDAIKKMELVRKEIKDKKLEEILNAPILRNENGECIIELFNKKKEKVGETIIDKEIYYDLKQYPWCINNRGYVFGTVNKKNFLLHRFIMNYTGEHYIDHINNNPLDNRKCNLRIVTPTQNAMNKISNKNSSSKYIGVCWDKSNNKWVAYISFEKKRISFEKKRINLGTFDNEIEAAKCRDIATKEHFGKFGNLNF